MINLIIAGISITLGGEFGYEVYNEEIKQGLKEPCFFISCLNPTNRIFLGKRYFRENNFCIQYFPKSEHKPNAECYEVAEKLNRCLELIPVLDEVLHGTDMKFEVIDGVLNFFVSYNCFVYKVEQKTVMGNIKSTTNVKG